MHCLGVVPERFEQPAEQKRKLRHLFPCSRGRAPSGADIFASEMTKWFDTNYHYLVPEITAEQQFRIASTKLFDEISEAKAQGVTAKPVLLDPVT